MYEHLLIRNSLPKGHDNESLLFSIMDEFLFVFSTDYVICKEVEIVEWDKENNKIKAIGRGEVFDLDKHPQGTEVKVELKSSLSSSFLQSQLSPPPFLPRPYAKDLFSNLSLTLTHTTTTTTHWSD